MKLPVEVIPLLIRNLRPRSEASAIFLSVVITIIMTCMILYVFYYTKRWISIKKWARIKIMPSDLKFAIFDKKKIISFEYRFGGDVYIGKKLSINSRHRWGRLHPKTELFIERAISENAPINIYVNPENPNIAYVDIEFDKSLVVTLALFILFAVVLIFIIMTMSYVE
jgi:hypothetical protein